MKITICILLTIFSFSVPTLYGQEELKSLYQYKIERYTKTKNAGSVMLLAGGLATSIGASLFITSLSKNSSNSFEYERNQDNGMIGAYVMGLGIDLMIGGTILSSVGNRKVKQYRQKLNNLSAGMHISSESGQFILTYRF